MTDTHTRIIDVHVENATYTTCMPGDEVRRRFQIGHAPNVLSRLQERQTLHASMREVRLHTSSLAMCRFRPVSGSAQV